MDSKKCKQKLHAQKKEKYRGKQRREESNSTIRKRNNRQNKKHSKKGNSIHNREDNETDFKKSQDAINLENQRIYEISCGDSPRIYITQTNKRINAKRDEQEKDVKKEESTSSLVRYIENT